MFPNVASSIFNNTKAGKPHNPFYIIFSNRFFWLHSNPARHGKWTQFCLFRSTPLFYHFLPAFEHRIPRLIQKHTQKSEPIPNVARLNPNRYSLKIWEGFFAVHFELWLRLCVMFAECCFSSGGDDSLSICTQRTHRIASSRRCCMCFFSTCVSKMTRAIGASLNLRGCG